MSTVPLLPHSGDEEAPLLKPAPLRVGTGKKTLAQRLGPYMFLTWVLGPLLIGGLVGGLAPIAGEPCAGLPPLIERLSTIIG